MLGAEFLNDVSGSESLDGMDRFVQFEDLIRVFTSIDSRFSANLYVPFTNLSKKQFSWEIIPSEGFRWHEEQIGKRSGRYE
jgi:hypothetical protein